MNKYLTLLCFSLIISQTFSKECTESDCDYTGIAEEDKEKYACVPKGEEECEEKLLCSHATKSAEDTSFKCSDYPVQEEGKICIENSEGESTTPCKEEFICDQVTKSAEDQIDCSIYPTTDKTKYSCVADDDPDATKACKEVEYTCSTVPKSVGDSITCSEYSVTDGATKYCEEETDATKETACKETLYCVNNEEGDCTQFKVETSKSTTHKCVEKSEGTPHCEEKYLCNKVPITSEEDCQNTVVSDKNKFSCVSTTESDPEEVKAYKCKEVEYKCSEVPKIVGETDIKCSDFQVDSDKTGTHTCIEDTTSSEKQCKQIKNCANVVSDDMAGVTDCSTAFYFDKENYACKKNSNNICQQVYLCRKAPNDATGNCEDFVTSDENYACVEDSSSTTNKCKENFYCSQVPKPGDNENPIVCSNYELSNEHKDTHYCIQNTESETYACKEEYLCESATNGANDEECAKYPVQPGNKDTHGCIKNSAGICKEENLCSLATITETVTDEICGKYPVAFIKIGTHICIKNPESSGSSCVEQPLCESVEGTNVQCENYPVKKENKNTHICVSNALGDNPCKEEKLCEQNSEATNDDECRKYPVTIANKNSKICIKNPSESTTGCIEKELCTSVTKGASVDCSAYPVSNEKSKTHTCKAVDGNDKCSEVEIDCSTTEQGESDEQCSHYKVSDTSKKCVKNTDTTAGASPCMEKALSACELKTSGATSDDVCNSLAVEKQGEQKCVKNPEGENCILLSYCQYGLGTSDTECAKFALQDSTKECKKKASENKCEEVEKTTPQGPGGNEETDTDSKENEHDTDSKENEHDTESKENEHDTDSKENETQGSDIDNTSDKADETKASDTTKTNPGTNGNNNNSGNYLNTALGLLLINYLVTLF